MAMFLKSIQAKVTAVFICALLFTVAGSNFLLHEFVVKAQFGQQDIHIRGIIIFLLGSLISILLGMLLSRRITKPVHRLVEGVRRISRGDLSYRVKMRGNDEIAELTVEFNKMAQQLSEAHKKNAEYFYGVIQSMVRIVEAKDHYTRGHSERVAEYAVKIARRMGFSAQDLDMLKQIAVLHDIGKLAIQDSILNKPGKLSPEEWEVVRMHPVTGEEILKPVLLDPQMLAIVRGHHERYDGKGYPDGLKENEINAFAQIISVADAYDAMTSSRAYRPASLRMEEAVQELQNNKGAQFSPRVVDVFCKILQEENN
jgi:putative nucleotidyltransferase with HDIG domain